jgi:hypothetical protein
LRHVASWQANPAILASWTAMKQKTGWRVKATSVSLAHLSPNVSRTQ